MANEDSKNAGAPFTGGDLLVKALMNEGVKFMFGLPGGQFLTMYDAIYRWGKAAGIQSICVRHEQAAAHMADAYARVTGQPGVCFGTVGPGATDMLPGVATAWADSVPVVAITPQVARKMDDRGTLQGDLDQMTLYQPIVKYSRQLRHAEDILAGVQKAFRAVLSGCPGPVHLELTEDALFEQVKDGDQIALVPPERYRPGNYGRSAGDPALVQQAVDLIAEARMPMVIAGGGFVNSGAFDLLKDFAAIHGIPIATTAMGRGSITTESAQYIGATLINQSVLMAAKKCDIILALGCRFSFTMGFAEAPLLNAAAKLVQVDINPMMIGRNHPADVGIVGDAGLVLGQIHAGLQARGGCPNMDPDWLPSLQANWDATKTAINSKATLDKVPCWPQRLVRDLLQELEPDDVLVVDGGDIAVFVIEQLDLYKPRNPRRTLNAIGMGHLGTGIPYCIGARLAHPDGKVIGIVGDGSFLFNVQELDTAVRLNTPFVIIIANDSAWGMIKSAQHLLMKKRFIDVDLPESTDYAGIAQAFGCYGEKVTDASEITPAFHRALESGKPAVIDVQIRRATPNGTVLLGSIGCL